MSKKKKAESKIEIDLTRLDTNSVPPTAEQKPEPKAVKIIVEYDDGTKKEASGDDAEKIMEHWTATEQFYWLHGFRYDGPCLKEVKKE